MSILLITHFTGINLFIRWEFGILPAICWCHFQCQEVFGTFHNLYSRNEMKWLLLNNVKFCQLYYQRVIGQLKHILSLPAFAITYMYFCSHCNLIYEPKGQWPQITLTIYLLGLHVRLYLRINESAYVKTVTTFSNLQPKRQWPLDDLDSSSVEVTRATLPKDHCVQVSQ